MKKANYTSFDKEVMRYYADQHSIKETAEKFGIKTERVKYLAKRLKVSNNRPKSEILSQNGKHGNEMRIAEAENKLSIRLLEHGFGYIGGYDGRNSTIKVIHFECGTVFERHSRSLDEYGYKCPTCEAVRKKAELEEKQKARELECEERRKAKAQQKELRKLMNPLGLSPYQLEREKRLDETFTCKVCGNDYRLRDYVAECGLKFAQNPGYCSVSCKEKAHKEYDKINRKKNGKTYNHSRRVRKFGGQYDRGITLRKAVDRYGLTCYLCGKPCDWNDHTWSKYCGPTYPSIDHIIPLSKGGSHTWKNIGVAHILCNSKKETTILP